MPARPKSSLHLRQWAGLACMLIGVIFGGLIAAGGAGCSSPEERYKTLSFFFDGVPDPSKKRVQQQTAATNPNGPTVLLAAIVSRHKPYVQAESDPKLCDTCHRSATGNIQEFDEAYKLCIQCHKDIPTKLPRMHGPVALADCKWCHTAHESPQPHLLKDSAIKVCTQCHDTQLLGSKPPEHNDNKTPCIQCHYGHGGNAKNFLKPAATPAWPTSAPATQSAPATAPATLHLPGGAP